jgi:indolepyruvate ferredoxin oxidoreductase beta subunit
MKQTGSISLVGVGEQGILLTSEIIARTAALAGLDVKKSEVHGMSQRGGSVISQVRYGERVHSPIIADGESDVLVAFECLEALRWRPLLKPDGFAIVTTLDIVPVTVSSGQQPAIENEQQKLRDTFPRLLQVDADGLAIEAGNPRTANMVLVGAISRVTGFDRALWVQALEARLPAKLLEVNMRAFEAGCRLLD